MNTTTTSICEKSGALFVVPSSYYAFFSISFNLNRPPSLQILANHGLRAQNCIRGAEQPEKVRICFHIHDDVAVKYVFVKSHNILRRGGGAVGMVVDYSCKCV